MTLALPDVIPGASASSGRGAASRLLVVTGNIPGLVVTAHS